MKPSTVVVTMDGPVIIVLHPYVWIANKVHVWLPTHVSVTTHGMDLIVEPTTVRFHVNTRVIVLSILRMVKKVVNVLPSIQARIVRYPFLLCVTHPVIMALVMRPYSVIVGMDGEVYNVM